MTFSSSRNAPKCPECEHGHLVPFTRDEEFDYDLGEESIKVVARDVPVERRDSCGMVASGPAAAKVRHEAVCRAAGFLTPTEYKSIREERGWSQQHLADLTGCGVATVSHRAWPDHAEPKLRQSPPRPSRLPRFPRVPAATAGIGPRVRHRRHPRRNQEAGSETGRG